jgi:hypothetical protein
LWSALAPRVLRHLRVPRSMALTKTMLGRCNHGSDASYVLQASVDHGFDRDSIHIMAN